MLTCIIRCFFVSIPTQESSCLCPDKTSARSEMHNNERVFTKARDCDGLLCEFCSGSDPPSNTCLRPSSGQGSAEIDTCPSEGASSLQAYCVNGDHCACANGFSCSDTKKPGECSAGTGGYVFCVPNASNRSTTPYVSGGTTARMGSMAVLACIACSVSMHFMFE